MIISVDFDNTIAEYDEAFLKAARARGFAGPDFGGTRVELREMLRRQPNGEAAWMTLQGYVYGAGIGDARLTGGFVEFARRMHSSGHRLIVVSHKTRFGHFDEDRVDLREAALQWMERNRLFDAGFAAMSRDRVYFEPTRAEKIARIVSVASAVHVDDLPDVFSDPAFPGHVRGILYGPAGRRDAGNAVPCADWDAVEYEISRVA